ncbi:MFS transporter [Nocardia neocaledoniensis]|uniref:MFS transporter n=1 Tax=Nocardia neocaledoniensis TaxID=236511 RepID=UPI002458E5FE|nr:MFS transporter [Nocardia neocaledoniensis]
MESLISRNDESLLPVAAQAVRPLAAPEPQKPVGGLFFTLYGFASFGLSLVVMMPALFSLPYKVGLLAPDDKVAVLGLVATVGAVVGLIAGPVAGVLSDRTRTAIGRRPPWLISGIIVLAAGSILVALSSSVTMLIIGWIIVSLGGAASSAAIIPIVAERVPEAQRGTVGAAVGVATQLAGVLGYSIGGLLTANLLLLFLAPVLALALFGGAFMIVLREPIVELPRTTVVAAFRGLTFNPRHYPDFSVVWIGKLLMQIALAFLATYQLYFVIDRLGFTAQEAGGTLAIVGGTGIVVAMAFAIVSGILSDRIKRRKPFIIGSAVLAVAGLGLLAFTDGFWLFFASVLFIVGSAGMFGSVDIALASDLVPEREHAGRWMSIYNLAATLSTAIAPLLGAALLGVSSLNSTNYTALFLGGAVLALGTGVGVTFVRSVR